MPLHTWVVNHQRADHSLKGIDCCWRDCTLCIRLLKTLWEPPDFFFKFKWLLLSANFSGRIHFQMNNEITQHYSRVSNRLDLIHTSFPLKDIITKTRQASNTNNTGYKFQISVQFIFGLGDTLSLMACRIKNHS